MEEYLSCFFKKCESIISHCRTIDEELLFNKKVQSLKRQKNTFVDSVEVADTLIQLPATSPSFDYNLCESLKELATFPCSLLSGIPLSSVFF